MELHLLGSSCLVWETDYSYAVVHTTTVQASYMSSVWKHKRCNAAPSYPSSVAVTALAWKFTISWTRFCCDWQERRTHQHSQNPCPDAEMPRTRNGERRMPVPLLLSAKLSRSSDASLPNTSAQHCPVVGLGQNTRNDGKENPKLCQ